MPKFHTTLHNTSPIARASWSLLGFQRKKLVKYILFLNSIIFQFDILIPSFFYFLYHLYEIRLLHRFKRSLCLSNNQIVFPLSHFLISENRKSSLSVKSGEYGGCRSNSFSNSSYFYMATTQVCTHAFSWWKKILFFTKCERFNWTARLKLFNEFTLH